MLTPASLLVLKVPGSSHDHSSVRYLTTENASVNDWIEQNKRFTSIALTGAAAASACPETFTRTEAAAGSLLVRASLEAMRAAVDNGRSKKGPAGMILRGEH